MVRFAFPLPELPLGPRISVRGPEVTEGGVEGKLPDDGVVTSSSTKLGDATVELEAIGCSGYLRRVWRRHGLDPSLLLQYSRRSTVSRPPLG